MSLRGPVITLKDEGRSPEFGVGRGTGGSKTYRVYRVFFLRKCFIVTGGRVDGRVDGR